MAKCKPPLGATDDAANFPLQPQRLFKTGLLLLFTGALMSRRVVASIRYDGPALADHEMDVQDLGPALLALGELCKSANHRLNGDRASVRVVVNADVERQCFQLSFEVVQTLAAATVDFLEHKDVATAKEILEWIGILGGGLGSVWAVYKFLSKHRKPGQAIEIKQSKDIVVIQVNGDSNVIEVKPEVYKLATDPRVLRSTQTMLRPLEKDGYETLEFRTREKTNEIFHRADAINLRDASTDSLAPLANEHSAKIEAEVGIHSPVYEGKAQWEIIYKKVVSASIEDEEWLDAFQNNRVYAPPNFRLRVTLEERWSVDESGIAVGRPSFRILKVHEIVPPKEQLDIESFLNPDR